MVSRAEEWAAAYGDLGRQPQTRLMQLPLTILDPWQSADGERQPFKAYTDAKLQELTESIKQHGVIEAICVRPKTDGRMEIIAGHNDPMESPVRVDDIHTNADGKIEIRKSFLAPVEIERRLYLFCSCCGEMYLPIFRYEPSGTKILRGEKIKDGIKV